MIRPEKGLPAYTVPLHPCMCVRQKWGPRSSVGGKIQPPAGEGSRPPSSRHHPPLGLLPGRCIPSIHMTFSPAILPSISGCWSSVPAAPLSCPPRLSHAGTGVLLPAQSSSAGPTPGTARTCYTGPGLLGSVGPWPRMMRITSQPGRRPARKPEDLHPRSWPRVPWAWWST